MIQVLERNTSQTRFNKMIKTLGSTHGPKSTGRINSKIGITNQPSLFKDQSRKQYPVASTHGSKNRSEKSQIDLS